MIYSKQEKALLGKTIITKQDFEYGKKLVKKGSIGKIIDFGKSSGDPLIEWQQDGFKSFVPNNGYILYYKDSSLDNH